MKNGTYPFIAEVHVAIRSDLAHSTMAYKMYEWLQTAGANDIISESGYIPKNTVSSISKINADNLCIYFDPAENELNLSGFENLTGLNVKIYDVSGRNVGVCYIRPNETINVSHLPSSVYIVRAGGKTAKFVKQ